MSARLDGLRCLGGMRTRRNRRARFRGIGTNGGGNQRGIARCAKIRQRRGPALYALDEMIDLR